jgi:Na+/H+-dicarboxylate symporter
MSPALLVFAAFAAGLAGGIAWPTSPVGSWLAPVGQLWVAGIRMPILPLLMAMTIVGVAGARDTREAGRLSARALAVFLACLVLAVLVAVPIARATLATLTFDAAATGALRATAQVDPATVTRVTPREWLVALVPTNPIRAMADGALLPLVVFSLCYGLALTRIADAPRQAQLAVLGGVRDALLVLIGWVLRLAPLGVLALAWGLGATVGAPAAAAVGRYLAWTTATVTAAVGVLMLATAAVGRVPLGAFVRALAPAQLIAVTTRSSLAALPAVLTALRSRLGAPERVTGVVVPLAASLFKLNSPLSWPFGAMLIARLYGVELDWAAWGIFALGAVLLSLTTPGIPSGGFFVQAPLYTAVGLPPEGLGLLIALDLVPDLAKTVINVTSYASATLCVARWEGDPCTPPG